MRPEATGEVDGCRDPLHLRICTTCWAWVSEYKHSRLASDLGVAAMSGCPIGYSRRLACLVLACCPPGQNMAVWGTCTNCLLLILAKRSLGTVIEADLYNK